MERPLPVLLSLAFATAACGSVCAAQTSGSTLVGDLGSKDALVIEGNKTFTKEQMLEAMALQMDYHLAAHSAAPLSAYLALFERKISLGYQRAGFSDSTVKATADTNAHRIHVRVNEGPRYRCGNIILSGAGTITNALVKARISDLLHVWWFPKNPARLDEFSRRLLTDLVQQALADLDYFQPKLTIRIVPDLSRELADLHVDFADEGIKGTIEEIDVTGLRINTRQQVLDFLKLKPGMDLHANVVNIVTNQLWQSARFFRHDVNLRPLPQAGKFKLALDLEELREAPPLQQEFSPETKALLKFRDWLLDWQNRPEDFVSALQFTNSSVRVHSKLVFSPAGIAIALRWSDSTNSPPVLKYAAVLSSERIGFYSAWRRSKFTFKRSGSRLFAYLSFVPGPGTAASNQQFGLSMGAGLLSLDDEQPFRLELGLPPAAFVGMAAPGATNCSLSNGVLSMTTTDPQAGISQAVKLDALTGRLIQAAVRGEESAGETRAEEGAFARLLREIADATAEHPNEYVTSRGFASWLSFLATDLLESPLLTEQFLQPLIENAVPENQRDEVLTTFRRIKPLLALAREALAKRNLAGIFEPLNRLVAQKANADEEESFSVLLEDSVAGQNANPMLVLGCAWALDHSDALLARGSWSWILFRETAFNLAGQGKYAQAELDKLLRSDEVGPAACLATAFLLGKVDSKLARTFANRGLSRLAASEFHKDYQALLETNSIVGQIAVNTLSVLGSFSDLQMSALTASLSAEDSAFLQQLVQLVRGAKDQSVADAAWPAIEQHWDKTVRRYLELGLNHFLPQVQLLTDSGALYRRGLTLSSPQTALQDFDEAAQCFRKAAEQGHAGAQMKLGLLYEQGQGVRQDFAEAMHWYRKAAEQREPHATCRVADLYRDGKGVVRDLEQAAKWYRTEADGKCTGAQLNLGSIAEQQFNLPEALKWYRRAAEGGERAAQIQLGYILSDGITVTPDYVEAYQWLSLAARAGDKLAETRLPRLKAKLTAEQLTEADQRAAAIAQRLAEKDQRK